MSLLLSLFTKEFLFEPGNERFDKLFLDVCEEAVIKHGHAEDNEDLHLSKLSKYQKMYVKEKYGLDSYVLAKLAAYIVKNESQGGMMPPQFFRSKVPDLREQVLTCLRSPLHLDTSIVLL